MPGKDIFFILADRVASSNWLSTLNIVKDVSLLLLFPVRRTEGVDGALYFSQQPGPRTVICSSVLLSLSNQEGLDSEEPRL